MAAGVSGVGKSMDMLAQYYIAQVQKIFPVIEVDAGRQVDIVVLKGMPLKFSVQRTSTATSGPEVIE
jgi:conjugal transfer pilus assembly protein TraB